MILADLSRALKTQNRLAAAIEFLIVIAGVATGSGSRPVCRDDGAPL